MLVVHAPNIHQGGGLTLLDGFLRSVSEPIILHHDARLPELPNLPKGSRRVAIDPKLSSRFQAERLLKQASSADDTILCMGNLPPLLAVEGNVWVFLQNRYLAEPSLSLSGLGMKARVRLMVERIWLKTRLGTGRVIVQSESMADQFQAHYHKEATVAAFVPAAIDGAKRGKTGKAKGQYDYIYVASGEAHKNHHTLIAAWKMLALRGKFPSLRLTVDAIAFPSLVTQLEQASSEHNLKIDNAPFEAVQSRSVYASAGALIYPSLFESFGLPLQEAQAEGLDILASERDFVRDISEPVQTFDPNSAKSIARAVMRHMGEPLCISRHLSADEFLALITGRREE